MNARFEQDFQEHVANPMAEVAKPLSAEELRTAQDLERGRSDRLSGKPQQKNESEPYNQGYFLKEIEA